MRDLVLLESLTGEHIGLFIALTLIGLLGLRQGWVAYTEPTPRFVLHYTGWSCLPLAMPYGGAALLVMALAGLRNALSMPELVIGLLAPAWLFGGLTFLLGFFFWFPPFLLPPWYRRARKADIPRNDPHAMGAFKALSVEQQRAAVHETRLR